MKILNIILVILIPLIIILTNLNFLAFNEKYYEEQFIKNNVYAQIPKEQVDEATRQLLTYLREGMEIEGDYFNEKEKEHLKDVRRIIKFLMIILYISILTATVIIIKSFIENKEVLGLTLIAGGLLTLLLIVLLALLLTNFQYAFLKFHQLAFSNNLWMLNPSIDKLIIMFPENFFYDITKDFAIRSVITSVLTVVTGITLRIRTLNKRFK